MFILYDVVALTRLLCVFNVHLSPLCMSKAMGIYSALTKPEAMKEKLTMDAAYPNKSQLVSGNQIFHSET